MADHGFDLEAVKLKQGGHSCFAPSASAMWLNCPGSLIPNLLAEDKAGEDAAYGTVAHGVAEHWLKTGVRPDHLVGTVERVDEGHAVFEIEIDEVMLDYVEEYVDWCKFLPGAGQHHIEVRVDFSRLTPIDDQGGTADHIYCEPGRLTVTDLKMGRNVQVFATGNTQARLYALGAFYRWDDEYHFEEIVIRIAQPRLGHFDEWVISRADLLEFAEYAKVRAAAAWQPDAERVPGEKQCQWCKVRDTCGAFAKRAVELTEGVFEDLDAPVDAGAVAELKARTDDLKLQAVDVYTLSTGHLAALLPWRKVVENWWKQVEDELERRMQDGEEVPGRKLVESRSNRVFRKPAGIPETLELITGVPADKFREVKTISPAQAEDVLRKAGFKKAQLPSLLNALVVRPPGKPTMVPLHDKRPALSKVVDDTFDDLDDEL